MKLYTFYRLQSKSQRMLTKTLLIMKMAVILTLVTCLQVSANGYAQKINLSQKDVSLKSVFKEIKKQSGYLFWYEDVLLKQSKNVTINVKNATLEEALKICFQNQPLTYAIVNNTVVVKAQKQFVEHKKLAIVTIKGRITDDNKEPLPGATIKVKGTAISTAANMMGEFELKGLNENAILVISFTGFITQEIPVSGRAFVEVALREDLQKLNEVVVIGYGTATKGDLTGAVGQVSMADLEQAPVRSFDEALAGRVAGVQVTSSEGQPGSGIDILIRGANSLTQDNSPLYVIDGFPMENPDNNILNPSDIASIDVLKDASAGAIYGARGANGVIMITTKRGKAGAPSIRYSGYYGIQNNIHEVPLMNPYEFLKLQYEMNPNNVEKAYLGPIFAGPNPDPTNDTPIGYTYTLEDYKDRPSIDWQHQLFQTAPMQSHSLALSGGNEKTRYSISGQVFQQEGTIINSGFNRYQGKVTLDQTVNNKLKIGGNLYYTNTKTFGTSPSQGANSAMNNFLYSVWGYRPVSPIGISEEEIIDEPSDDLISTSTDYRFNPIMTAENQLRENFTNNIVGNVYGEYMILKDLKLRISAGLNKNLRKYQSFNNSNTYSGSTSNPFSNGPNGSVTNYDTNDWLNENTLTYDKKFNKDHSLNVVGGLTMQENTYSYYGLSANTLPNEALGLSGLKSGVAQPISSYNSSWTMVSGLTRANYTYKDKYIVTASFRADASSKFAEGNQWAYFPSGAFAWRAINEDFLDDISFLSNAKLRLSWGITGNNRIGEYDRFPQMDYPIAASYSFNDALQQGIITTKLGNPAIKWESTEQTDLGIDLGFFKERITFTADLYRKNTRDLLLNASLPPTTGYGFAIKNIGQTRNEGVELSLNTVNFDSKNFKWTSSFNIAFNRNKVIALTENQESLTSTVSWDSFYGAVPLYIAKIGQPIGQIYGYIWDGVYQYEDFTQQTNGSYLLNPEVATNGNVRTAIQPGDIKYRDINADGVVNDFDRTVIGRAYPIHQGGFSNNFRYKSFDLNAFFQWSYGNDIVNANRLMFEAGNKSFLNQYASFEDRWTPEHTNTTMHRAGGQYSYSYSTRVVEDGSFLRLKTVSFGYNFPKQLLQKVKVSKFRVYASAQNLVTWTKYTGPDPEVSVKRTALTPGFDYSAYPRARTITFGANVTF